MAIVKQRDSNLELLRIVAMSMIVIYHIFVHGISPVYVGSHSILTVWYVPFIFGVNLFYSYIWLLWYPLIMEIIPLFNVDNCFL